MKPDLFSAEAVAKVNFPHGDVKVTIDGRPMHPFMGLTSWAAFQPGSKDGIEAMLMGDLVLLEDEVNPAMSAALDNSLEVTALHNHFFFDLPNVYFMHIGGEGSVETLASGVRRVLEAAWTTRKASTQPPTRFQGPSASLHDAIDGPEVEGILGAPGQAKDGMFKVVIGREARAGCGCVVGKNMGVNTWAAFGGDMEAALVCGDFAVLEEELQPVLRALRGAGINIVAIHNHMVREEPRFVFLHYWGKGPAMVLAQGLRAALDRTHGPDPPTHPCH